MECHYSVNRSFVTDNIKWLDIIALIVCYADDPSDAYVLEVFCGDRIFKVTLVDAVALFGDYAAYTVAKSAETVIVELCLVAFKKNRYHPDHLHFPPTRHYLKVGYCVVICYLGAPDHKPW